VSQLNVERIIGRLVTDEEFRRRFRRNPPQALAELAASGYELNPCERRALLSIAPEEAERFAGAIDPRLQKGDLKGDCGEA
jgi:hypothetical protein